MKLVVRDGVLFVRTDSSSIPLREVAPADMAPFMIGVGPFGKALEFFGYHPETRTLYLLKDTDVKADARDLIQHQGVIPIFALRRAIGGPGTLPMFWANKENKVITKHMVAAMQYYVTPDEIVLTHMSVQPKYRRQGVNTLLVDTVMSNYPGRKVVFDDPTPDGKRFMRGRGFESFECDDGSCA